MNGSKAVKYSDFFFASQNKRWEMLLEVFPALRNLDDAEFDLVCDIIKDASKEFYILGAKNHPNKKAEKLWVNFFNKNRLL